LKLTYGTSIITDYKIEEYINNSNSKDKNYDLFTTTANLLYNFTNIDNCLKQYETEKVILPMTIHYNYHESLIKSNLTEDEKIKILKTISESLSYGDNIENFIYGEQCWDLQEIHGFFACVIPSYYLTNAFKDDKTRFIPTFSTDFNKTSTKSINKRNITKANKCFDNMGVNDYIYINKLISKQIIDGNVEECAKILKEYNVDIKNIDSILKIDKIAELKTSIVKFKKKLEKFIIDSENKNI
jgi:hypothetical protein